MSFSGLTLRDLEYVVAVARAGTFTAAAERCAVSQPTLSAQVRKVESQLGVALFERAGREVRLTAAGDAVVEQAARVLAEARRLFEVARGLSDPLVGDLQLGAIATLGPYLVPHLIAPLREAFPALRPIFREGLTQDLLRSVLAGELDAAIVSLPVEDDRLVALPVFFEPFVAACPAQSPLAGRSALSLEDLDDDRLLLMDEGHCLRAQALSLCRRLPQSARHAASIETLRHLIAAGIGHSILPRLAASADPAFAALVSYVPLAEPDIGRTVAVAWRASDPRTEAFATLARQIAAIDISGTRPPPTPQARSRNPGRSA